MKLMFSFIAAWLIGIAGLSAAFGFELPKIMPDKGAPYGFGHHYDYDNAGSSWNQERVYRHPGHQHLYRRWYYHYGHKPKPYRKHHSYPYKKYSNYSYEKYGYYSGRGYSRYKAQYSNRAKYALEGYAHRKFIQLRDRIPSHSFKDSRPFNRVHIGR